MSANGGDLNLRGEAGFTLTETLVAVALLATIAAAATPVMLGGADIHARLTGLAVENEGHAALERALREAVGAVVHTPGQTFEGEIDQLRFVAQPYGATELIHITIQADAQEVTISAAPISGGAFQQEIFTAGSAVAGFYFFGRPEDEALGWYRSWPGPHPPRLIILDLEPGQNGGLRRIEAAIGARAALSCDYDSGLQACREGI